MMMAGMLRRFGVCHLQHMAASHVHDMRGSGGLIRADLQACQPFKCHTGRFIWQSVAL